MSRPSASVPRMYRLSVNGKTQLLPKWGWDDKALRSLFFGIHEAAAYVLIALIVLHVAGAIKHQLIDRDNLLARMLP